MTAPTRDEEKRFLEMTGEEIEAARKIILDEMWGYIRKYEKGSDPLLIRLTRQRDGRWTVFTPERKASQREREAAPTWGEVRDREAQTLDVTEWANELVRPMLARNDDHARKIKLKDTVLLCRAGMTDAQFLEWAETLLPLLLCPRS